MSWMARRKSELSIGYKCSALCEFKLGPAEIKMLTHWNLIGHSMTNLVPGLLSSSAPSGSVLFKLSHPMDIFCLPFIF
jgi:hypothetical protein